MTPPIVLLLRGAKHPKATLRALEAAGYVPLVVDSFDDVRELQVLPGGDRAQILQAALAAIDTVTFGADAVRQQFAKEIIKRFRVVEAPDA